MVQYNTNSPKGDDLDKVSAQIAALREKEAACAESFREKRTLIAKTYGEEIAALCDQVWDEINLDLRDSRRIYRKEDFLQLPVGENLFHYLFKRKTKQLDDEFGEQVSVPLVKAWNTIDTIDDVNDRIELRGRLLKLAFSKTDYGFAGVHGIPGFDRPGKVFSIGGIHPSMLLSQFSEETKSQNKSSLLEKFKSIIVRNLINHELGEKEGGSSALKKYNINETYKNESLLIPKTHPIHNFSEEQMKEFFMTKEDVRELEERACYNLPMLVELLKINMVYDRSIDDPDMQYSHILLADKEQYTDSAAVWKIAKIKSSDQANGYDYVSRIKRATPKKPMLLYGFVNEKATLANTTQKTTSKLAENLGE